VDVELVRVREKEKLRRLVASPAFARAEVFDDDLVAIQMHKSRRALNRPTYVGMSILDLSKTLRYDFYYRGSTASAASSSTQTQTASSSRSRQRTSTGASPSTGPCTTRRTSRKATRCDAPRIRRSSER
ncbi:MAG: hypothetical protein AB2556_21315, partial [Candidatus Thiodiazotropha sp.]